TDKDLAARSAVIVLNADASNEEALAVLVKSVREEKPDTPADLRIADWFRALFALANSRHGKLALPHLEAHLKKSVRNPPERITLFEIRTIQTMTYHLWLIGTTSKSALPEIIKCFDKYQADQELRGDVGIFLASFILYHQNSNDQVRRYIVDSLPDIQKQLSR